MVLIDYFADGLKPGLIKWNVPGAAKVPEINYYLFVVFFVFWLHGVDYRSSPPGIEPREPWQ